jgi:predicted O-methyltransferase YrrM
MTPRYALFCLDPAAPQTTSGQTLEVPFYTTSVARQNSRLDGRRWIVDAGWPHRAKVELDMAGLDEGSAALLKGMVMALQPDVVLETGTHKGRSTQAIASALVFNNRGHLWTVDMEDFGVAESGALSPHELERTTLNIGTTPGALEDMLQSEANPKGMPAPIEFAYLDGDHTYEGVRAELEFVHAHSKKGCTVMLDNTLDGAWVDVEKAVSEWVKNEPYQFVNLPTMTGMAILRRMA